MKQRRRPWNARHRLPASEDRDKSSAELEREDEHERELLTRTLDEIRGKLSLGQIVDQAVRYARESGGGEFTRNLGRSVRDNPLPVAFIGAGIGWHLLSGRMDHDGAYHSHGRRRLGRSGDDTHGDHGGTLSSVRDRAMGETSDRVKDEARDFAEHELDHAKSVAEGTTQEVADEFKSRGLTPESAREATSAAARKAEEGARRVAQDTKSDIGERAGTGSRGAGTAGNSGGTQAEPSRDRSDNAATTPNRPGASPGKGDGSGGSKNTGR